MDLYVDLSEPKRRKSIQRLDSKTTGEKKAKPKHEQLIEAFGLQNFTKDLVNAKIVTKSADNDLIKADNAHLPNGAERCAYEPDSNYGVIYIPVNRLRQVYQTDKALSRRKINENRRKIREGIPMPPVEIGYNYDIHDGHHRWVASTEEDCTHVPCKVVGTDPEKVREARKKYLEVWKSLDLYIDLSNRSLEPQLEDKSDRSNRLDKSDRTDLAFIVDLDLSKAMLHKGKLVRRRIPVKGKNGKIFYRMQWVDPNANIPGAEHPGKDESTYAHHEHEINQLERAQSTRFPVVHHSTKDLKVGVGQQNYRPDHEKVAEAEKAYKNGEKLPPIRINPKGEVIMNQHLVEMAKKLGLSHVPVIVMGNPAEKKKLEDKLKDEVMVHGEDESGKKTLVPAAVASANGGDVGEHPDVAHFKNVIAKRYTKQHIMDEARKQGIKWVEHTKSGESLENHPNILWKNAHMAIVDHIRKGNPFTVSHDEKDVDARMKQEGYDTIHKHFLKLLDKHGSREALMDWARKSGITWKEKADPSINWMYAATAIKKELAKGRMVGGVRTRQKEAMTEANTVVTEQIKDTVREFGQKYGKKAVMDRADELGILYDKFDAKGNPYDLTSPKLWMNASVAIQKYIAQGNTFAIGEDNVDDTGIAARVGDYGEVKLTKNQSLAVDLGKRNSQRFELKAKEWAFKALRADNGPEADVQMMYEKFMQNARNARMLVHFDPFETLPSGVTILEQMTSDGHLKNNWELGKVGDIEAMEINERELFDIDYDETPYEERPNYGVIDLFNQGLKSSPYGEVAFVLKEDAKKRATGVYTDSNNLEYETNGKLTRSLEDPHHLIVDKWKTQWKNVAGKDAKRKRYMDAIINGEKTGNDGDYFEAHLHGGLDLRRDVDHILVPSSWQTDKNYQEHHEALQYFSSLMGTPIKYE